MKLTKFAKLKRAVADLDINFIANRIREMESHLTNQGRDLDPESTVITEEGIYYISADSGMATKVALYVYEQLSPSIVPEQRKRKGEAIQETKIIEKLNEYHIVRCNTLTRSESRGWDEHYRIAQCLDGHFYYRLFEKAMTKSRETLIIDDIENQKLFVCKNCLLKVISLIEGFNETSRDKFSREKFELKYFFDIDFARSWLHYDENKGEGAFAGLYPKDWERICKVRKSQVDYHCEGCSVDLSSPSLQQYLHVMPTEHHKRKVGYVRLQCFCLGCLASQPKNEHMKRSPGYQRFMQTVGQGDYK